MLVLFVCRANSKRSQVAAAFFNGMSKKNTAISAGLEVLQEGNEGIPINPFNVEIMKGMGYDLSKNVRTQLTREMADKADLIIAMAEKGTLPDYLADSPKLKYWKIDSTKNMPYGARLEKINHIKALVEKLVYEIG